MKHSLPMILPPPVEPGSVLRLIAPSGPFSREHFEVAAKRLGARFDVRYREDIFARHELFAGTDTRRAEELQEALDDADARAILTARGGYGASRLLGRVDFSSLKAQPKWLAGFSDVTALHSQWTRAGLCSLHAPMVAWLGAHAVEETERVSALLESPNSGPFEGLLTVAQGEASGPLLGGNLAVLTSLVGTPYFPDLHGSILFLEDVGERPYRIDRMLVQLRLAGALDGVRGVVLGEFVDCEPGPAGVSVDDVVRRCFEDAKVPVAAGLPVGHGEVNRPLVLGQTHTLSCGEGGAVLR